MSSVLNGGRQVSCDTGYYIPLANITNKIFSYNATATGATPTFAVASWAAYPATAAGNTYGVSKFASSISTLGAGVLKDMGRTVISSGRTFRKVQLVTSTAVGTDGVNGVAGTSPLEDFLTGYVELGFNGNTNGAAGFAPLAAYGR